MPVNISRAPAWRQAIAACCMVAALAGCATLRDDYAAVPSVAFDRPEETALGRAFSATRPQQNELSGFRLINTGVSALMTLAALADLAERSIDIQYYIYAPDETGAFLLERLLAAAERGVRVRMLLDDHPLAIDDAALARLDAHPNIEIRIFNPYRVRARWTRPFQLVFNLDRLGRRMHNKVFAVDGQIGVIGGRNIGNHYMEGESGANFRDFDILATGPVIQAVSKSFDAFWANDLVVPVAALGVTPSADAAPRRDDPASGRGPQAEYAERKEEFVRRLLTSEGMIWASARAIAEPPLRQKSGEGKHASAVFSALTTARRNARQEIVYGAAYFVPGEHGVKALTDAAARGVRVRVLTNSLASTDVVAVHAGYARHRAALLAGGVELHEYRNDAKRPAPAGHRLRLGSSDSALHAKVVIYDRRLVWVGSANFDPRSRRLNTESGLLIDSVALAERLLSRLEVDFAPEHSWRLTLEDSAADTPTRRIVWHGIEQGRAVQYRDEPGAGFLRHLGHLFFSILPGIEDHL